LNIIERPSPNFNDRRDNIAPDFIILHYTDMKTAQEALDRLCDPASAVSAHYLIDTDGTVYSMVPEDRRAWHAGKSYWNGEEDMNSRSIGIELANPGHSHGYAPFPAAQMQALAELCREIRARHNIPSDRVLGHSDIAPARKRDPGELFDWKMLAAHGIGLWPEPLKEDFEKAAGLNIRAALTAYGYTPHEDLETVLTAFQRHFHPEIFRTPERVGQPNMETAARLQRLRNLKSAL
jgi:N-acetylmuramoyl-L-alanine amidase